MNHYVYLIEKRNSLPDTEKYYIGVRSCECKIGDDDYMSSSKFLKEDIEKEGINNFNKIVLKRFDNRKDAMSYEIELHEQFDVAQNPLFFNKAKQKTDGFSCGPGELNPFFGKRHTEEYKIQQSALMKTKDCRPKTTNLGKKFPEIGPKISKSLQKRKENGTWVSPWTYTNVPEDQGKKISEGLKQFNRKETCIHCGFSTAPWNISRWHNDNCKLKKKGE